VTIGLLGHDGFLSATGYARDAVPLCIGWWAALAAFRGRFLPTWLVGTTLGVVLRTVTLGHYHWNVLAFWLVALAFLGATAALMRVVARRLGVRR
jgi:hypothetical protein